MTSAAARAMWICSVVLLFASSGTGQTVDVEALKERHQDSPSLASFESRMELVNQLGQDILAAFEAHRSSALQDLLVDVVGGPAPVAQPVDVPAAPTATQLIRQYARQFESPIAVGDLSEEERKDFSSAYTAAVAAVIERVAERGKSVAAADPEQAMHAMALSLVLPLLHVPDAAWTAEDVQSLPEWVLAEANLAELEDFALRAHRPLTAYVLAVEAGGEWEDRTQYLRETSDRLLRLSRFDEAVRCLGSASELTQMRGELDPWAEVVMEEAQVLSDIGRPADAAEVMRPLLEVDSPEVFGRAAMLRLKYLHEAGDYPGVLSESPAYQKREAGGQYLPQILYITWVAARRDGSEAMAERAKNSFLEFYPDHALAADFYFADAVEALGRSDYDEASRILEYVAYRFPESRLTSRVEQLRARLRERRFTAAGPGQNQ